MIKLFNIEINGNTAKKFCQMDNESKRSFIKRHTNQQNDVVIDAFLAKPIKEQDCGCGCGGAKNNTSDGGNITEGIQPQAIEPDTTEDSGSDVPAVEAGRTGTKKPKAKRTKARGEA